MTKEFPIQIKYEEFNYFIRGENNKTSAQVTKEFPIEIKYEKFKNLSQKRITKQVTK